MRPGIALLPRRMVLAGSLLAAATGLWLSSPALAQNSSPVLGMVVMHGKGGSPTRHVSELAAALESRGYRVINLDMPWSARREYDASLDAAEKEVDAAITTLRSQGVNKVFVAGHSQGGLFALYFASRHVVDGVIAMAPGGDPSSATPREKLADAVRLARSLLAQGKGNEKVSLADYEGAKGTTPLLTTPAIYLSWFDPDNAFGLFKAAKRMDPAVPVLYVAPGNDYPALAKIKQSVFDTLPRNAMTRLYEPNATHLQAPTAAIAEIVEWTQTVAKRP